MLRADITPASLQARQADCPAGQVRPGRHPHRGAAPRRRGDDPAVDAGAQRLSACRQRAAARRHRRRLRLHGPPARRGEELHHDRAEEQLPRHRARRDDAHRMPGRAPRADDARLVGDGVRAERAQARAVPLHPADPVRDPPALRRAARAASPPSRPAAAAARRSRARDAAGAARRRAGAARAARRLARSTASCAACWCSRRAIAPARWLAARDRRRRPAAAARLRCGAAARAGAAPPRRARGGDRSARRWFDPWVFELDDDDASTTTDADAARAAVFPWVAGFATALELFPGTDAAARRRRRSTPLALLYRHLDADDLEDADELLAEIESLEPPADLTEAVEELVRATLLLADVARPARRARRPPSRDASQIASGSTSTAQRSSRCSRRVALAARRRCSCGSQARRNRCSAWRERDSTSICMRSTSATRATPSGTGG